MNMYFQVGWNTIQQKCGNFSEPRVKLQHPWVWEMAVRASLHFISCSPAALGTFYLVTYRGVSSPSLDWVLRVDSTSGPCIFPKLQGFSKGGPGTPLSRDLKSLLKMQMTTENPGRQVQESAF